MAYIFFAPSPAYLNKNFADFSLKDFIFGFKFRPCFIK
ncbi:hypothetical protein HMPREF1139_0433 [Campylobacter sp. FOBRC14]|nr:hypothetical protein HMPREF1139_0433 [Campylobacter sp. FOBRC14]